MPVEDWAPFQDRYADLFTALGGDPQMALFIYDEPGESISTLIIPSFNSEMVETLSPGGWEDYVVPAGKRLGILVANADAHKRFGVG